MVAAREAILAGGEECIQWNTPWHTIDLFLKSQNRLVVCFESAGHFADRPDRLRMAWGAVFLLKRGYSVLAVKALREDWFRCHTLHAALAHIAAEGVFRQFRHVVFYGGSMGGYASLAFCSLSPGATVIALSPQSTMSPALVPWENRFAIARKQDWSGLYIDAAEHSASASAVYCFYDPLDWKDQHHVARLPQQNVVHLKVPFVGHEIPLHLQRMGILTESFSRAASGEITPAWFAALARRRKTYSHYWCTAAKFVPAIKARSCLERAIALAPRNAKVYQAAAEWGLRNGRSADALDWADAGLAIAPTSVPLILLRARALHHQGRKTEALKAARTALAMAPTLPQARALCGWLAR